MLEEISGNSGQADIAVRRQISDAIRRSNKSRAEIAEEMSRRLECRITASMLNDYTAETKGAARFPAAWIAAFCAATNDDGLQRLVMGARLRKLVSLGEREVLALRDERERHRLIQELVMEIQP